MWFDNKYRYFQKLFDDSEIRHRSKGTTSSDKNGRHTVPGALCSGRAHPDAGLYLPSVSAQIVSTYIPLGAIVWKLRTKGRY